jgi:MFS transporter, AAHS family, 4-hydroxybenzoate transporter
MTEVSIAASESHSVHVSDVVDRCTFRGLPLLVSTFTVLTFVFDGFDIQAVAFVAPDLLKEWGITRAAFGPVLAAGLIGMALGSLLLGPLGDRVGRRSAIVGSLLIVALGSLASAFVDSAGELAAYRFLTGLGIGGGIPSATALMMEFAPLKSRNLAVSVTVVGVPIGGVLGAEVAARLLPTFGWQSVFVAGALLPVALAIAMWLVMPESPRFLARRPARSAELARMLNRLVGADRFNASDRFVVAEPATGAHGEGLAGLLTAAYRRDTLFLWLAFFTSLLCIYSFFNWLPTVLTGVGLPITAALRGALAFNLGGVIGAVIIASAMTRFGSKPVMAFFGATAIVMTLTLATFINSADGSTPLLPLLALMLIAGVGILSVQVGLYALAAYAYPTACRASGVGAAVGIGRTGGIVSSFAGAAALAIGNGVIPFFVGIASVLAVTTIAILVFRRHMPPAPEAAST